MPWLIFVLSGVGVPLLQMFIYNSITSTAKINDPYVGVIIFVESVMAVALLFYLLLSRRTRGERQP